MEGWYGGQSAGTAITDVLFGDYNPSGRLPVTVYQSLSQLPDFQDYSMKNRTYRYFSGQPLYAFGFGLSYTSFRYDNLSLPAENKIGEPVELSVDLTNTGSKDGEEVVQLYLTNKNTAETVPIRSLKGFSRVFLKKGETRKVSFLLLPLDMSYVNNLGEKILDPGFIEISIGGCQPDQKSISAHKVLTSHFLLTGSHLKLE
jgi:beta-glucosidase